MHISATVNLGLDIFTTFDTGSDPYANPATNTLAETGLSERISLSGTTVPALSKRALGRIALTAGAATIDLTNFTNSDGTNTNANALKLVAFKFRNLPTNTHNITIAVGGTNGYALDNGAFHVTLAPGQSVEMYLLALAPSIDATHKTLDLTGTGTDVLEVAAVFG